MDAIIDGYNLMHALGLAGKKLRPGALSPARTRLLNWLADHMTGRTGTLRVVFDGAKEGRPSPESEHRGIRVRFSHRQTADELIEELLRAESLPKKLAVVSNDGQVQEAGRRRGCRVLSCESFIDEMNAKPKSASDPQPVESSEPPRPDEMVEWLAVFTTPRKK